MTRSILLALVVLVGCTGDDDSAVDADAAVPSADAGASGAWAYEGEVFVGTGAVSFQVGSVGDGCETCRLNHVGRNGCLSYSDVISCGAGCLPCLDEVRVAWDGGGVSERAEYGNYEFALRHEAEPGDFVQVTLHGCLGPQEMTIQVPEPASLAVQPPVAFGDRHVRIDWSPSQQAPEIDVVAHWSHGGIACRRADTGSEVVPSPPDWACRAEIRRLYRVGGPGEEGHLVRYYRTVASSVDVVSERCP